MFLSTLIMKEWKQDVVTLSVIQNISDVEHVCQWNVKCSNYDSLYIDMKVMYKPLSWLRRGMMWDWRVLSSQWEGGSRASDPHHWSCMGMWKKKLQQNLNFPWAFETSFKNVIQTIQLWIYTRNTTDNAMYQNKIINWNTVTVTMLGVQSDSSKTIQYYYYYLYQESMCKCLSR